MMELTVTTDPNGVVYVSIFDGERIVDVRGKNFWRAILVAFAKITFRKIQDHIQSARA